MNKKNCNKLITFRVLAFIPLESIEYTVVSFPTCSAICTQNRQTRFDISSARLTGAVCRMHACILLFWQPRRSHVCSVYFDCVNCACERKQFIHFPSEEAMAKGKNLKRKAAPVVKKAHNEWLDETIEPSAEEEVCTHSFHWWNWHLRFEVKHASNAVAFQSNNFEIRMHFCRKLLWMK